MDSTELRKLREARGLTREELAVELGCSAGGIVQWELDKRKIPAWVAEKMLRSAKIELPLLEIQQLLTFALEHGKNFEAILAEALQEYLARRTASQTPSPQTIPHVSGVASSSTPAEVPPQVKTTAKVAKFPRPIMPESELKVAETATAYKFTDRTKKKA